MDKFKDDIADRKLQPSTVMVYVKNYTQLRKALAHPPFHMDFLKNITRVMEYINNFNHYKKKILLATVLIVLSPQKKNTPLEGYEEDYEVYKEELIKQNTLYNASKISQTKTPEEKEKWLPWSEVVKLQKTLKRKVRTITKKGIENLTYQDKKLIRVYLLVSLYALHPPRRLEYGNMEIITQKEYNALGNLEKNNKNYLITTTSRNTKYFSFGNTKVKTKEPHIKKLSTELNQVLNLYLKIHSHKSLLLNTREKPATSGILGQDLTRIFSQYLNKPISSTALRHMYLSEILKDNMPLIERTKLAEDMNHSLDVQEGVYLKHN